MKTLIFIISIFAFNLAIFAQNNCPTISVSGPPNIVPIGENMTFTANVEGIDLSQIKYEWTVSVSKIADGQGTSVIYVPYTQEFAGQTITATVRIIGLPDGCVNTVSASGEQISCPPPPPEAFKIDEYEMMSWSKEKIRLQNLISQFKADETARIFFMFVRTETQYQLIKIRLTKIGKYLSEQMQIPKDRIIFVDQERGKYRTNIWIVPQGAIPPQ